MPATPPGGKSRLFNMFEHFLKIRLFGKPNSNFKPRDQDPKSRRTDPRHPEAPEHG